MTSAGPFDRLSLEHSSTVDRVVEELRRALFEGELDSGTPLREVALADAMGVSRSTVREALAVLVAEGLATRAPNRGVTVTDLDRESLADVCRARIVLETAGVWRWASADEAAREGVRRAVDDFARAGRPASAAEVTAAHLAIHRSFVALTGSPRLLATADALYAEVRLALAHVDRIRRNHKDQLASHRELLAHLEAGRVDEAAEDLTHHLEDGARSMLRSLTDG